MPDSTTVRVARSTRDELKALAEADGLTLDEEVRRLTRAERQRRFGAELSAPLSADDETWLDLGARTVARHAGG